MQIRLSMMCIWTRQGAPPRVSNYTAAVSDTMTEPRQSLSSQSIVWFVLFLTRRPGREGSECLWGIWGQWRCYMGYVPENSGASSPGLSRKNGRWTIAFEQLLLLLPQLTMQSIMYMKEDKKFMKPCQGQIWLHCQAVQQPYQLIPDWQRNGVEPRKVAMKETGVLSLRAVKHSVQPLHRLILCHCGGGYAETL